VSSKYGIYRHIRFGVEVERAQFDTENNLWVVSLASGETLRGRHLISACGGLISPKLPDIEGLDAFEGEIIHTARWPEGMDPDGQACCRHRHRRHRRATGSGDRPSSETA
jgi:cation diffusion facilitator CzcD-associated flavoprotein CzcO